jgi:hypothetical protein
MSHELTDEYIHDYGVLNYEGDWEKFYRRATDSKENFLVKTHFLPFDNQPVIHVARDGRLATESYLKQYQNRAKRWPGLDSFTPNFHDLVIGRDHYSDWTDHFRAWEKRENASRLLLRYEDIVEPSTITLQKIADFIGHKSEPQPFENKRTKLTSDTGEKRGKSIWGKPDHRTSQEEALFTALHAELLLELEYASQTELDEAKSLLDDSTIALGKSAMNAARERYRSMFLAMEKESVIQDLLQNSPVSLALRKLKRVLKKQ